MLNVTCDAVDQEMQSGRPCIVIRAYRWDRELVQSKEAIEGLIRRLRAREKVDPTKYPEPPLRITVEGVPKSVVAENAQIYELSVGVTSFNFFVFEDINNLGWLVGKELQVVPIENQSASAARDAG